MFRLLVVCVVLGLAFMTACNKSSQNAEQKTSLESNELGSTEAEKKASKFIQVKIYKNSKIAEKHQKASDLMFNIMAAEIAGHRQDMKGSIAYYLKAIKISNDDKLAERATRISLYAKDSKGALIASKRWAELSPKNAEPHRFIAILHLRKGEKEKSLIELKQYYKMLSGSQKDRFARIINIYSQETNRKLAFDVVKTFIKEHGDNAIALYAFSRFAMQMRNPKDALSSINKAIGLMRKNKESLSGANKVRAKAIWHRAQLLRAQILMASGQKKRAINEMHKILKSNPKSRGIRISYARLLSEAKQYNQARLQFEVLLKQKPSDTDILYALAILSLESKKLQAATKYLKKMINSGRRQNEGYYYLGLIAEERRRYDAAISWLAKVRQGDRQIDAHLRIASIMSKKGDVEAARRFLYQLKPRTKRLEVRLYLAEADILNRANRLQDAMDVINNALNVNPKHFDLLYARAMMAEKLNRIDMVERDLKAILKKSPKNSQALNALGYTLADRTKRYEEALSYIKRALEISPNQAAIVDSMGWVLYRMGKYKESVVYLRRALKLDNNAEIAAHLGEVLWVMGNKKQARIAWSQGKKINKKNKTLQSTLKRFKQ